MKKQFGNTVKKGSRSRSRAAINDRQPSGAPKKDNNNFEGKKDASKMSFKPKKKESKPFSEYNSKSPDKTTFKPNNKENLPFSKFRSPSSAKTNYKPKKRENRFNTEYNASPSENTGYKPNYKEHTVNSKYNTKPPFKTRRNGYSNFSENKTKISARNTDYISDAPKISSPEKNRLPYAPAIEFEPITAESGKEFVYGLNVVEALLSVSKRWLYRTYYTKSRESLIQKMSGIYPKFKQTVPIEKSNDELTAMVGTTAHQGIVVECDQFPVKDSQKLWLDNRYVNSYIALDNIQDPQNVGSIIRNSLFFGISNFIITEDKSSPINATVAKASAGVLEQARIYQVVNLSQTLLRMKKDGFWVIGTDSTGKDIKKNSVPEKYVLVLGNEKNGMRKLVGETCDYSVGIRGNPSVESLNVSSACAILLFHLTHKENILNIQSLESQSSNVNITAQ